MNAENDIRKLMAEYDEAHHAGDGVKLASFFLDDAVIIPPEKPKLIGRSAIDQFYSGTTGGSNMNTTSTAIKIDTKTAYVQGDTEWQTVSETRYLSFVNVLQFIDGQWRYSLLTWNTNDGLLRKRIA